MAREPKEPDVWIHPLAGADWAHFISTIGSHRGYSAKGWTRILISALALSQRWPCSRYEDLAEWLRGPDPGPGIGGEAPVFIIGHWGSGTTWVHQLLASDQRFTTPDTGDCLMPHNLRESSRYWRWYLKHFLPSTRGFDAVRFSLEEPQEEEMALAALGPVSYFHTFYFPRDRERHREEALFPETLPPCRLSAFERAYTGFLRRIARRSPGRLLLVKNPASTTRIPWLEKWFPGSRFIHVVRDPEEVAAAALNRVPYLRRRFSLQRDVQGDLEEEVLSTYEQLMRRYLRDRVLPGEDRLVEIRYEELVEDPRLVIGKVRETLGLPRDDLAHASLEAALARTGGIARRKRSVSPGFAKKLKERWRFAYEYWGYSPDSAQRDQNELR